MTTHERWENIKDLFDRALALAPEDRTRFLAEACGEDSELRSEVEALLEHDRRAGSFLEGSPAQAFWTVSRPKWNDLTFSPGELVSGRFRVVRFIGCGGMGEVYEANDSELGVHIALKTLRPEISSDPWALSRFKQEVQLARQVTHANVCRMFDIERHHVEGQDPATDRVFLTMELLDGTSLSEQLHRNGPMRMEEAFPIIQQMAEALQAAHEAGVIHTDFKPSNVLLVPTEPSGAKRIRAVVTDFGLARAATASPGLSGASWLQSLSRTGHILGTLAYMAPEQLEGRTATVASDIYAFGLVVYEVLTGVQPFQGDTPISTAVKRLTEPPMPLRNFVISLTPAWESAVLRCLERDPAKRFGRVQDAIKELTRDASSIQDVPKKQPLRIPLESPGHKRWGALVRMPRAGNWSLAAVAVALLLFGIGISLRLSRQGGRVASLSHVEYMQLTDFADAVTSPALSPDGRMLAMVRGEDPFIGPGDIYVKLLPSGEPVQLTHDDHPKMGPVFSLDGSQIAFTRGSGWDWQTWTVPVLGGEPSELLPNASGLTWIGPHQVMFSEMEKDYTKIVTAGESRANERDVYLPPAPNMAHRSYISPDSKWVLVVEMGEGGWLPCRLVPFAGGSTGRQVGPVPSGCTEAAWAPDGQWMYLAAHTAGGYHLWRQRFPHGIAEQVTFGATEEHGIAVAPDGRSLITAVASRQSTIWVHGPKSERQISSQGFAYMPSFSWDGKRLYYLARNSPGKLSGDLRSVELNSGHNEQLLPGISIARYVVSPSGKRVAFTRADTSGDSGIWISPVDRHSPPRQLVTSEADMPKFSRDGDIFFVHHEAGAGHVFRMKEDGTEAHEAIPDRTDVLISVSPDGRWIVVANDITDTAPRQNVIAYPLRGGRPRVLCTMCAVGTGEVYPPLINWSSDQKSLYISLNNNGSTDQPKTVVIPLNSGAAFPQFWRAELLTDPELSKFPGVRVLNLTNLFPGPDATTYALWRMRTQSNLYRVSFP
jgi:eukaryotic-like serine/threonine-protein kinase